ncbi:MAG: N-carbamoylputrescine amidase [Rhodovibrionaceae bacterium]
MTEITLAATQMPCSWNIEKNLDRAEELVREAAGEGAQAILLQELFETPYFCPDQKQELFALAKPRKDNPLLARFSELARELEVVLPISFFERANNAYFNSLCVFDADGRDLGLYRKSHIPDGPGYQEKFYFNPGDTGFKTFKTRFATIGVGICWDQWFPECARAMALQGAEVLFYPTAIGNEPQDPSLDSKDHWQRAMQGHSASNMLPLVAANRVGSEISDAATMNFYGHSFITGFQGEMLAEAGEDREVIAATVDLDRARLARASWGFFRDRRPELYDPLLTLDGEIF